MNNKKPLGRITVTISHSLMARLLEMRSRYELSISAMAEVAIQAYLDEHDDRELESALRAAGAKRRRVR